MEFNENGAPLPKKYRVHLLSGERINVTGFLWEEHQRPMLDGFVRFLDYDSPETDLVPTRVILMVGLQALSHVELVLDREDPAP